GVASSGKTPKQVATNTVKRIKEAGGNIAANKYRGHGVSYAETLEDTWKALVGPTQKKHASLEQLELEVCVSIENVALRGQKSVARITELTLSEAIKRAIHISKHLKTPGNFVFIDGRPA